MKKCENKKCNKEHNGEYGSGRFCSLKCAKTRNNQIWTEEQKQRQSIKLKNSEKAKRANELKRKPLKQPIPGICEKCGIEHSGKYGSGRFCSSFCSHARVHSKETRKKTSNTIKQKLLNGEIIGWAKQSTRKKIKKECNYCNMEYYTFREEQKYCSRRCASKVNCFSSIHKKIKENPEWWSDFQKELYLTGKQRVGGGTSIWYEYKDIKVQGTYELRTCKILDNWKENNKIKDWEYTKDTFQYIYENEHHTYLMDFKVFENNGNFYYIETKGYEKDVDKYKWESVTNSGFKLEIWFKDTIDKYEKME